MTGPRLRPVLHRPHASTSRWMHVGLALCGILVVQATTTRAQTRQTIVIDAKLVFPESLTSAADGTVWIGSTADGTVYRARPTEARAQAWIASGTSGLQRVLGVLADEKSGTLWVCSAAVAAAAGVEAVPTSIKAFDLATAAFKSTYGFVGGGGCNDMAVAPDGTVYATDLPGARVMRLRAGRSEFEPWAADARLASVDGIAMLADGSVYVNTIRTGTLIRIPVAADGTAGPMVTLRTSAPLLRPDGMRPAGPATLLIAEGEGRLAEVTIKGDEAEVRVIREGFTGGPVAVTLVGNVAYVLEAKFSYRSDPALRGQDPGPFQAVAVPYQPKP